MSGQVKFHYNKEGIVAPCNVDSDNEGSRGCPFEKYSGHFETEQEAKQAFEDRMDKFTVRKIGKTKVKETPLSDIMNLELLRRMDKEGYVSVASHPDDLALKVLCYGKKVQFEGAWNEVTKQARGLVIRSEKEDFSDAVIIERPWAKFFTLSQMKPDANGNTWALGDEEDGASNSGRDMMENLDFDAPAEVTDKVDGCFPCGTALNLWGGGTITIDKIVKDKIPAVLIGEDENGQLVPTTVTDWHDNGTKDLWLDIEVDTPASGLGGADDLPNKIRVTFNHEIPVNGNYIPASEIKVGDKLVSSDIELDDNLLHLIRSSLLGDGSLTFSCKNGDARWQEGHSEKQLDYVMKIREVLGNASCDRTDNVSGYGSKLIWAGTKSYKILGDLNREWYSEGKKIIPQDLSWVDNFTIAKWFMDNGYRQILDRQDDRISFAINSFEKNDVVRLGDKLNEMYGVSYYIANSSRSKGNVLIINSGRNQEIKRMWAAIASHIVPSMRYKLPEEYRDVEYIPMKQGNERRIKRDATVLSISVVEPTKINFPAGCKGFDITTTTHNYFARGILVHNSMGVLYRAPDGKLALTTKGRFDSEQATYYTNMLRNDEKMYYAAEKLKRNNPQTTFVFEMVGPENQIVLEYENDNLVFLGAIDSNTGKYRSTSEFNNTWGEESGLDVSQNMDAKSLQEALALPPRANAEGVVVRLYADDPSKQMQIKIKQDDYLKLHRLASGLSTNDVRAALRESKPNLNSLLDAADSNDPMKIDALQSLFKGYGGDEGGRFKEKILAKHRDKIDRDVLPVLKTFSDSYKEIKAIPDSEFQGDEKEIMKKHAIALQQEPNKIKRGFKLQLLRSRLKGEEPSDNFLASVLAAASKNLKS